jgi:hypothetical protein
MYQFSNRLKSIALVLIVLGLIGIVYGFLSANKTTADVEAIIKEQHAHHGGEHHVDAFHDTKHPITHENHDAKNHASSTTTNTTVVNHDSVLKSTVKVDTNKVDLDTTLATITTTPTPNKKMDVVVNKYHKEVEDANKKHKEHVEHVQHQLQNKPWSALYVACMFFMFIALGALAFYAIQWAAQSGWSPILFRVMEGITSYLLPGSIIFFVLLVAASMHLGHNHMFVWMAEGVTDPKSPNYDHLVAAKSGFLNVPFFLFRAAFFLIGWNLYRWVSRKNSIAMDKTSDVTTRNNLFKKNYKAAAAFLVFFIVSESIMSWDWVMSVDPHWYSTLFGWYVFASFFVSGITVIALITIYLVNKGLLPQVNASHLHDLAKFMFGISIFWTYLWFSQFMLIWYSNIPEEVTYFHTRIEQYNLPFFGMLFMNFLFPLLILMNAEFKRLQWIVVMAGIVILAGHYIDFFNMIMPATVGDQWFIGIPEISSIMFFAGLFIYVVFTALGKTALVSEGNPYIEESKHFHY